MSEIRNIINKFLKRNKDSIDSTNTVIEMNGMVLVGSHDADFDFKSKVIKEVTEYCSENGIKHIDKVVIISVYDSDIFNQKKKIIFDQRQIGVNESKIIVVKAKDKTIAQVIFNEYLEIQGNN